MLLVAIFFSAPAQAGLNLTFEAPNIAAPDAVKLSNGNVAVADKLQLSNKGVWSTILGQVFNKQGFTAANNWSYSTDNITSLSNDYNYTVTNGTGTFDDGTPQIGYKLQSSGGNALDESIHVTLNIGSTTKPSGTSVTQHWVQVIHEDRQYGNYGFAITGQQGFWQIDNGDQTFTVGSNVTPFYDVAFSSMWSASDYGDDPTVLNDGVLGAYLHFYTIPVWDVQTVANSVTTDTLYMANAGISWGFSVVPEPGSIILVVLGGVSSLLASWTRSLRKAT